MTGAEDFAFYGAKAPSFFFFVGGMPKGMDPKKTAAHHTPDFYIDADSVRSAVASQRLFNLMHFATGIKVDLIVRKGSEYRQVEFARRRPVELSDVKTWIVSREDLILSKLVWAKDSGSELQHRDVRTLLDESMDRAYLEHWAARLDVADALAGIAQ